LARGETVHVDVGLPEPVAVAPEDVDLVQQTRPGWGLASDTSTTVALDLDLESHPALQREGMVREVIHHVQNLRKSAGLDVADRIELRIQTDPSDRLSFAVASHASVIAAETLATDVVATAPDEAAEGPWDAQTTVDVDGTPVRLLLRKV
jgi:isoleucyl-tRNA synthetase